MKSENYKYFANHFLTMVLIISLKHPCAKKDIKKDNQTSYMNKQAVTSIHKDLRETG